MTIVGDAHGVRPVIAGRRPLPYAWADVRARLQADIFRLLPALGIHERVRGSSIAPPNPNAAKPKRGPFVIWIGGSSARWHHNRHCPET